MSFVYPGVVFSCIPKLSRLMRLSLFSFDFSMKINGINAPLRSFNKLRQNFIGNIRSSFLKPEKFLSSGGFGAVWSANYSPDEAESEQSKCFLSVLLILLSHI